MKKILIAGAAIATLMAATAAHAAYPSIGADTLGPQLIIDLASSGATIINGPGFAQGPYVTEDAYIGVNNHSGRSIGFLDLASTGLSIFSFDSDGICPYTTAANCSTTDLSGNGAGGNHTYNSGYAGVGTFFTNITDSQHGRINFTGGLADGSTAFFGLEEPLDSASFTVTGVGGVPEPAAWALMLIGFFGVGGMVRSRRLAAAVA